MPKRIGARWIGVRVDRPRPPTGRGGAVTTPTSPDRGMLGQPAQARDAEPAAPQEDGPDRIAGHARALVASRTSSSSSSPPTGKQLVHRVQVVDVQLAVEVVELVLERPPQQSGARDLDLLAVAVLGDDPDLLVAGHVRDVARDRQAALEVPVVAGRPDDPRVDQLVELALDLDHAGLQRLAELRRREPDAGRIAHRVREVVEELVEVLAEAVDRLALEAQARVAEHDDRADAHGGEV